jgi:type IX secretion system PorP/SprF family membrane protein
MERMNRIVYVSIIILSFLIYIPCRGQDPSFSQFFSSPLNINPSLTGHINEDWRVITNMRDQWIGPASPYSTGTICYDMKVLQNKAPNVKEKNVFGIGSMLMYDYSMYGVVKGEYGSIDLAYNIKLSEDDYGNSHRLGLGFGGTYVRKFVDFNSLNFQTQYTGNGFDTNLPTGEAALSNMRPYFSLSAGAIYSYVTDQSNLDIGGAIFHLNHPMQTFLANPNQYLPRREVIHSNYERYMDDRVILNANGVYQYQSGASYFSIGGGLGYNLNDEGNTIVNGGVWYWSKNAIIPYVGIAYMSFQIGLSYDATVSKLAAAMERPNTWELSLALRGKNKPSGIIPCPWK